MFSVPSCPSENLGKFVRILEQVKSETQSALEFSQAFTSYFTRLWRHGEYVLFILQNYYFPTYKEKEIYEARMYI